MVALPYACSATQARRVAKKACVADPLAQRLERHRPAHVDRAGEQLRGPGIAAGGGSQSVGLGSRASRCSRFEPLRGRGAAGLLRASATAAQVAKPSLSQMSCHALRLTRVAEPLVGELVGDSDRVGAPVEDRPGLGLERVADRRRVVDDRAGLAERVGPEEAVEEPRIRRDRAQRRASRLAPRAGRRRPATRSRRRSSGAAGSWPIVAVAR